MRLRTWLTDVSQLLPMCGAYLAVATVCAGLVYGGERLSRPVTRSQIELERRVNELETENRSLRLLLDQQRRAKPGAANELPAADLIPATALPTK